MYRKISIHALREEGDPAAQHRRRGASHFYPRPPRGGRPGEAPEQKGPRNISIHALREEGDFQPGIRIGLPELFLSTPSARRATKICLYGEWRIPISIHALREEGDKLPFTSKRLPTNFYPRPPRGGRPGTGDLKAASGVFLSTPSARRATLQARPRYRAHRRFLSTPSARRATRQRGPCCRHRPISIHALREEGDLTSCCFSGS